MTFRNVPGLGFYPTDDLVLGYLKERVLDEYVRDCPNSMYNFFPDIDLYRFKPWDLPPYIESSLMGNPSQDEWYFFCPRNGTNRTVPEVGYWKITGRKQQIFSADTGQMLGTKSILVFHESGHRSSNGEYGSWVVHEYHLNPSYLGYNIDQMPFVACCLKRN